jgi:hypothetical protein
MPTLELKFKTESSFEKAKTHFDEVSNYSPDNINDEFKTFSFEVSDQDEANILESYIESELNKTAYIQNYYFEFED